MRINRFDLIAFGPFTEVSLDLSAGAEGLHLIFGQNEAGKSSALKAIKHFFQGIPRLSPDDFIHPHPRMRIGARLRNHSGLTLEAIRRKGNQNTLRDPDNSPIDDAEARLSQFLGGISPAEYLSRFVIDHAT